VPKPLLDNRELGVLGLHVRQESRVALLKAISRGDIQVRRAIQSRPGALPRAMGMPTSPSCRLTLPRHGRLGRFADRVGGDDSLEGWAVEDKKNAPGPLGIPEDQGEGWRIREERRITTMGAGYQVARSRLRTLDHVI